MEQSLYHCQARLLLRILPLIESYPVFALKGGTAIISLSVICPRLSVDIDLTYIMVDDRQTALAAINNALEGLKTDIERLIANTAVTTKKLQGSTVAS